MMAVADCPSAARRDPDGEVKSSARFIVETDQIEGLELRLEPLVKRLGHRTRRRMCRLYVAGLIGPRDPKCVQPMADWPVPDEYEGGEGADSCRLLRIWCDGIQGGTVRRDPHEPDVKQDGVDASRSAVNGTKMVAVTLHQRRATRWKLRQSASTRPRCLSASPDQ